MSTKPKTTFAGKSPFRDPDLPDFVLAITKEPMPRRTVSSKYDALFEKLSIGSCIQVADGLKAQAVACAIQKIADRKGKRWAVRYKQKTEDGIARVWVLDASSVKKRGRSAA